MTISSWQELDYFAKGFLEALFFVRESEQGSDEWDMANGSTSGDIPNDLTFDRVHPDSIQAIAAFCSDWQEANIELLDEAQDYYDYVSLHDLGSYLLTGFTGRKMDVDGDDLGERLESERQCNPDDFLLEWDGEWVYVSSGIPSKFYPSKP